MLPGTGPTFLSAWTAGSNAPREQALRARGKEGRKGLSGTSRVGGPSSFHPPPAAPRSVVDSPAAAVVAGLPCAAEGGFILGRMMENWELLERDPRAGTRAQWPAELSEGSVRCAGGSLRGSRCARRLSSPAPATRAPRSYSLGRRRDGGRDGSPGLGAPPGGSGDAPVPAGAALATRPLANRSDDESPEPGLP